MKHRLIIGALAALPLLAASLSAQAADMPLYKAPPPAPVPFSWTGFYIGAHVGGGWGSREFDFNDLTPAAPFLWDSSAPVNGPLAGGQIGANWQAGWAVLGVEADGSWANLQGKGICNTTTFFLNCAAKTTGLATVTGRLGVDLGSHAGLRQRRRRLDARKLDHLERRLAAAANRLFLEHQQ